MHYPEKHLAHKRCSINACLFTQNLVEVSWGPEPLPWPLGGGAGTKEEVCLVATEQAEGSKEPLPICPTSPFTAPSLCL